MWRRNQPVSTPNLRPVLKREVAAMIEGLLRHCTDMQVKKNFVDTHGQSEVDESLLSPAGV